MQYSELYKDIEEYVVSTYGVHIEKFPYHNLDHIQYVVNKAKEIAAHYELTDEDNLAIYAAAWFHDIGYLYSGAAGHELESAKRMRAFLEEKQVDETIIVKAEGCIMATRVPRNPQNLIEQILADADTYNLGTKRFKGTNDQVYRELLNANPGLTRECFDEEAEVFFSQHKYFTTYAKDMLDKKKAKNMKKLKKKNEESDAVVPADDKGLVIDEKQGTTKGMQTMLRLTSSNHIQLSEMADSKANILISVNAIIISVILSVLFRKLADDPYLTIPTMIFLLSAVTTIVLAIMATRPKVNAGTFNEEDVINKKTNLLFFGNFHRMRYDEYSSAMKVMMTDANYLYSSMLQDIYNLGTVLGKKYKLLRIAYTIFMVGIIVSVVAFAVAVVWSGSAPVEGQAGAAGNGSPF